MNHLFANDFLKNVAARVTASQESFVHLDKNELPYDLPQETKEAVSVRLSQYDWNRYPATVNDHLEAIMANYAKIPAEEIVLGAGSAHLLTNLINFFAINRVELFILQPSFTLFEYHCKSYNIPYKTWSLDSNFEYDRKLTPYFPGKSAVILASPNNPTGNLIDRGFLVELLKTHSNTYFIVDEVYYEFCGETVIDLVSEFENLIVVRSLSKAFGIAGLRIGYLAMQEQNAKVMRKLVLPFSLNYLSRAFVETVLPNEELLQTQLHNIERIALAKFGFDSQLQNLSGRLNFKLFPGVANFSLLKFETAEACTQIFNSLSKAKLSVLNLSRFPMLANCLRITIGTQEENEMLFDALAKI